jgi:SurA N-terminal domain
MYKSSKNTIVKVGGYTLMGFFVLVIIISFGVPSDWMNGKQADPNIVATVNGDKIERLDLTRTIDQMMDGKRMELPPEQMDYVLNMMINDKIMYQYALKTGIDVSDAKVVASLRKYFTDPQTNRFNELVFKRELQRVNLSVNAALAKEKSRLVQSEMSKMFNFAASPTKDEILFQNAADKASFQIRYAFLSNEDFRKKNAAQLTVTDAEIDAEMNANKKEIENPATDRAKFKERLLDKKLQEAKKAFVAAIDQAALAGASFDKTAAMLSGSTGLSEIFKAGDQLKEQGKTGKPLYSLSDSEMFRNGFAALKEGVSSRTVLAGDGIYIYTPLKKDFKVEMPAEKDYKAVADKIIQAKQQGMQTSVFTPFMESSKIERRLKNQ